MSCCAGKGCEEFFSEKMARHDAQRYRKKGLSGPARRIAHHLHARDLRGATVLEVGGGVGALELELLKAGAERGTLVEISPAYEPYALELTNEAGLSERVDRRLLDFAEQPEEVEAADVVVMNKVVCCYPDYRRLVGAAAGHARRNLVMSFPRRSWWTRAGVTGANLVERLRGQAFRAYVHPPAQIVAVAEAQGLERVYEHVGVIWQTVALERR